MYLFYLTQGVSHEVLQPEGTIAGFEIMFTGTMNYACVVYLHNTVNNVLQVI